MKTKILAAAVLLLAAAARAEHDGKGKDHEGACKADVEKFCKDVTPGGGRIMACLKAYEDKVSEACKAKGAETKGQWKEKHPKMAASMEACKADKDKFCKDVEPGEGRVMDCMKSHGQDLSSGCRETMEHKGRGKDGDHQEKRKE
jgi:hypothetical protein